MCGLCVTGFVCVCVVCRIVCVRVPVRATLLTTLHCLLRGTQVSEVNAVWHEQCRCLPCLPCALPHPVYALACVTRLLLAPGRVHTHTHTHAEICVRRSLWHFEVCVTKQVTQKNSMSHVVATWLSFICCSAPSLALSRPLARSRQHRPLRIRRVGQLPALPRCVYAALAV